jgi:CheY-like chemotaxis protein
MNGILGMNGLLLETPLCKEQRKYAVAVQESAEALLTIINDILDISKLEAGKVEIENIDFELLEMVKAAMSLLRPKAREKGLDLGLVVDPAIGAVFRGDPTRIRQVLLNLIGNAIKFTAKGRISIRVSRVIGDANGGPTMTVQFEISDTGIGMTEEAQVQLFQKFSQADSSITRRFGGTGLGLAICKQLVELMRGSIEVSSKPDAGSTFSFQIPLEHSAAELTERRNFSLQLKGVRALVVDDSSIDLEILSRQLGALGMEVTCIQEAFGALAELERACYLGRPFDIVFMGQIMPGIAGMLVERLRAMSTVGETKLVLVASAGPYSLSEAVAGMLDASLYKPVRQFELIDCLLELFGSSTRPTGAASPNGGIKASASRVTTPRCHSLRILVAEDNKINQQLLVALLEKAGHRRVTVVEDGYQAVEAVRQDIYDTVLMDIQMPDLDGVQATQKIRALQPPKCDIPIIALTGNAMNGAKEQYLAAGMNDYISKPIKPEILFAKLRDVTPATEIAPAAAPATEAALSSKEVAMTMHSHDLDGARLGEIEELLSQEAVREMLQMYLLHGEELIVCIRDHLADGDLASMRRAAHELVGMANNIGVPRVGEFAALLEQACSDGDQEQAAQLMIELYRAHAAADDALHARFVSQSSTTDVAAFSGSA